MIVNALIMTVDTTTLKFSQAEIKSEGLTIDEYQMICDRLNHELNKAELGMSGVILPSTIVISASVKP